MAAGRQRANRGDLNGLALSPLHPTDVGVSRSSPKGVSCVSMKGNTRYFCDGGDRQKRKNTGSEGPAGGQRDEMQLHPREKDTLRG